MPTELEEPQSQSFDLQHILGIVRRRHLYFLIPLFVGWLAVWLASWILPARYKSGTLILVEQPTMPKDYVTPNVNDDLQQRLQTMTQQILSRTRLMHIIDQFNLYSAKHNNLNPEEKVERMRKDIDLELVEDNRQEVHAFNVYYSSADPHIAQSVTSELTKLFISENLQVRQEESEGTTKFLEDQLQTAREGLTEQEAKMRAFKAQHIGALPTQLTSNLQILSGLQSQLQTEETALNTARQQRVYLESLISQYSTLRVTPKTSDGAPVGLPAVDQELDRLKAQLADLSSRYTDRHPDVRKLKDQIAKTEAMRDSLLSDLKTNNASNQTDSTAAATETDPSSPLVQLRSQLQANQIEIKNRESTVASLKERMNDYQSRLNQEPVWEQQMADLARGYDQSKANYDELLKKKNASEMATSMELLQQGERFRILDPPSLPLKPDFPNRLKFCGIALGVGLALGVVVAGGLEFLDDRLHAEKQIKDLLPFKIVAEIPEVVTGADEKTQKRQMWLGWVAAAMVVGCILLGSAFSYLRG